MKNLIYQAIRFIGLSGIGWILDVTVYLVLGFFSKNLAVNNIISSWVGVTFVFFTSTRFIFHNQSQIPLKWKYAIYLIYQAILILEISHLLVVIYDMIVPYFIFFELGTFAALGAKIAVTPVTMILNFIVMKMVIEKVKFKNKD